MSLLNHLYLFSNVKITRDYAVTHDMTPQTWFEYLLNGNNVQSGDPSPPVLLHGVEVNYYRLPDVIRIEANYDKIRKATYGCLQCGETETTPTFKYLFFWIDSVRLVKVHSDVTAGTVKDVVELTISEDLWSNKFTDCELYDTFIARRHEDRWWRDHSDPDDPAAWVYHPRYFPNAADDVGGAYAPIHTENISGIKKLPYGSTNDPKDIDFTFYLVSVMDNTGKGRFCLTVTGYIESENQEVTVVDKVGNYNHGEELESVTLYRIANGKFFEYATIDATYVQSIVALPTMKPLMDCLESAYNLTSNKYYVGLNTTRLWNDYRLIKVAPTTNPDGVFWIENGASTNAIPSLNKGDTVTAGDVSEPSFVYDAAHTNYNDSNEPMLFRSPARIRKVVTGMGGTAIDVPDIAAFNKEFTCQNMVEFVNTCTMIYGGTDIKDANGIGNMGSVVAASLPIYESSWKNYEAVQKTGDDIAFNAQQVSTIVGTVTGAGAGGIGGAIAGAGGGPAGAVAGAVMGSVGGVAQGITRYWSNSENLRAKRETIKNSPCVVVATGAGFGAAETRLINIYLMVLRLEDVSYNKLRTQYYYYGYNINMVIPGTIDTKIRKYFDYIETRGARIRGDVNAEEAQDIAAAFDRGVRIYHGYEGYQRIGAGMSLENPERAFL